jgi:hypothetical protein
MHTLPSFAANQNPITPLDVPIGHHTPRGPAVPLPGTVPPVTFVCFGLLTILACLCSVINDCESSSESVYSNLRQVRKTSAMQIVE